MADADAGGDAPPEPVDEPAPSGWRARLADLQGRAEEARSMAEARVPGLQLVFEGFGRYQRLNGPALAGLIAFRLFSWVLPVALVTIAATGLAADQGVDVQGTAESNLGLGGSLARTLNQATQETQSSRVQLAIAALSGLLLATSGLLSALHLTHATLWEVPDRRIRKRGKLLSRLLGGVPLFMLIILASSTLRQAGLIGGALGTTLTLAVVFGVLVGIGWILPRRATTVRDLLPGAIVGTAMMVGLQAFATWYLAGRVSRMSATYGAFGIALTLLLYLFLLGQIIVISTLVNSVMYDDRHGTSPPPDQRDDGDDPVRAAEALDADAKVWP
jgi:uncharacterized BrkB/YihY/UPF0761 family membrane protein